jgi:signal transduction histidine kinase
VPGDLRSAERDELAELTRTGVLPVVEKELVPGQSGRLFVLMGRAVLRREGKGLGVGFVVDVTARKQIELERARLLGELRQAVRARDEFLSIAAHELRTPLMTPLRLQVDNLARTTPRDGPGRAALGRIDRSLRRLERLISELLDVARLSAGRLKLDPSHFDLVALVAEVAERWRDNREGAELRVSVPASPVVGTWDRLRIDQVVENLVSNAVKYGRKQPIDVELEAGDGEALLRVRDRGIGIAAEALPRIFERFERVGEHRHYGGFGLGLWIAQQAIMAHGGRIEVQSRPGEGSTFTVHLPLGAPSPEERADRAPAAQHAPG